MNVEILAPAGSYESMRAAMNAGCDAVYIGGSRFGARAYADNPDEDTLLKAIDEAHIRGKKLYLTVNTLVKEEEMQEFLYDFLEKYYLAGLDAVIVQDVGVMRFIHRHFPKLPIHASTQATVMMPEGARLLKSTGVTRLVAARELSLEEIKYIRDNTDMEIEAFVHGALCYCYSGQCLLSSMIGGRSGNRGRCAQPCRMPYRFYSGGEMVSSVDVPYLLSPKDINTIAIIPDLIESGVNSFKIEGRMKGPEYAAGVTSIYRKYVDLYLEKGKEEFYRHLESFEYKNDMTSLMDLYNRGGFSRGYGGTYHGRSMMSMARPNHGGVLVGEVMEYEKGYAYIRLDEDINAQDVLEIRDYGNRPVYEFTVKDAISAEGLLKARTGRMPARFGARKSGGYPDIRNGYGVYRTRNNKLLNDIRKKYMDTDIKREITGFLYARQGERLSLTLSMDEHSVTAYHNPVEAAKNQPMTRDRLAASVDKLGDTPYSFKELAVEADDNIFVPVSWLNEIRRDAAAMLTDAVTGACRRTEKDLVPKDSALNGMCIASAGDNTALQIVINAAVSTAEQFETALRFSGVSSIYADYELFKPDELVHMAGETAASGKAYYVVLPHICRQATYKRLEKDLSMLAKRDDVRGFIIKNLEEAELLLKALDSAGIKKELRLNHNMYVFNREAKQFWREKGICHFTAPLELNEKELKTLGLQDCELVAYGFLPVMVSVQCLYDNTKGCGKCRMDASDAPYLTDRLGMRFYVRAHCGSCNNIIYNGQRLSLLGQAEKIMRLRPEAIRLDFTFEGPKEAETVLKAFEDAFIYGRNASLEFENITTGHFKRGVE